MPLLPYKNRTISILRLSNGDIRNWSSIQTGLKVYINGIQEEVVQGYDGQPGFLANRMMTDGVHEVIGIGDHITDDRGKTFEVRGFVAHDQHHQYLISEYVA